MEQRCHRSSGQKWIRGRVSGPVRRRPIVHRRNGPSPRLYWNLVYSRGRENRFDICCTGLQTPLPSRSLRYASIERAILFRRQLIYTMLITRCTRNKPCCTGDKVKFITRKDRLFTGQTWISTDERGEWERSWESGPRCYVRPRKSPRFTMCLVTKRKKELEASWSKSNLIYRVIYHAPSG